MMSDVQRATEFCREGWKALVKNENSSAFCIAEQILSLQTEMLSKGRRDLGFAYEGYSIKGIVYSRRGNLELATQQLGFAGKSLVPTPSVKSFGPNFCLAQVLYEKGCRKEIVEFISEYCLPVCLLRRSELESWINDINADREVSFKGELEFNSWLYI